MSYYGVRYKENVTIDSIMFTYFTSSKYVHNYIAQYGLPDIIEIRKTFSEKILAKMWEQKVISRGKFYMKDNWLNAGNNGSFKNIVMSDDIRQKISETKKRNKVKHVYINNGIINARIVENSAIPDGYILGRLHSEKQKAHYSNLNKIITKEQRVLNGISASLKTKGKPKPSGFGDKLSKATKGISRPWAVGDKNPSKSLEVRAKISKSWATRKRIVWFYNKETKENIWVYREDIDTVDLTIFSRGKPSRGEWYNDGENNIWVLYDGKINPGLIKGKILIKKKWVTNEIKSKQIFEHEDIPDGWRLGRNKFVKK